MWRTCVDRKCPFRIVYLLAVKQSPTQLEVGQEKSNEQKHPKKRVSESVGRKGVLRGPQKTSYYKSFASKESHFHGGGRYFRLAFHISLREFYQTVVTTSSLPLAVANYVWHKEWGMNAQICIEFRESNVLYTPQVSIKMNKTNPNSTKKRAVKNLMQCEEAMANHNTQAISTLKMGTQS